LRLAMTHSYRTFVRSGVSTKPGEVQSGTDAHLCVAPDSAGRSAPGR
jgi:hypothetical protein